MKTKRIMKTLLAILSILILTACGSGGDDDNNSSSTYSWNGTTCVRNSDNLAVNVSLCGTSVNGYYQVNGLCYTSTGSQVDSSLCDDDGYYNSGDYCYDSYGYVVDPSYCSGGSNGWSHVQCHGNYEAPTGEVVYCDAYYGNCAGAYLYSLTTGDLVLCY